MSLNNFSNIKLLIVEEQPLALSHLRRSLEQLQFKHIYMAEHAVAAIELCANEKFDLIICSFDLTKRQNGYQLYEELKNKNLIKNTTAFIFVSAETSGELVHSVLELQPDDFLVKPFSIKELKARLTRVLKRKSALKQIFTLIDDGNDSKAVKFIDKELDNNDNTYSPIMLKLKGEALLRLKRVDEAKTFYKSALSLQKFAWAKIGLVEALIANKEHVLAQRMLKTMLERSETRLVALDLLGRLEMQLNQFENAQTFLQQASSMAPRNIERQKNLGRVASINHDYESSYNAHKDIAQYAKHSIHDSPEIYLNAARAGIDFALATDQTEQINRITRQTQKYLGDLKKQFPNADNQTQLDVLNARIHYLKDEHQKAIQLINQLEDEPTIRSIDAALDKAKACHELGMQHKAQDLFTQIIQHCERHKDISDPTTLHYIHQQKTEKQDITMGPKELNNHAVTQFNRGRIDVALEAFTQAFRVMPKNASIALNLAQCLLDKNHQKENTINTPLLKKCFALLNSVDLETDQKERLGKLKVTCDELGLSVE